jgi:hypothetical protein
MIVLLRGLAELAVVLGAIWGLTSLVRLGIQAIKGRNENKRLKAYQNLILETEVDDPELARRLKQKLAERLLPAKQD